MKKKVAILGSTGSIGKTLFSIIKKDKKNFDVELLTGDKNYKELLKQAKLLKVKNLIITDQNSYLIFKKKKIKNINVYNNFSSFKKIFKKKIDYVMSSIIGLDGLSPTLKIIKYTKNIAIANKEAIICGWNLIDKELKKNKTKFIPVDSEHFSIWSLINNKNYPDIKRIYITASGGPFLLTPKRKFSKITVKQALNHPTWKMGKKISIDSATLMNKIFEVIEAKNIFNLSYDKISILIHPNSYVHAIVEFNNGLTKILIHETSMYIPIYNTLYHDKNNKLIKSNKINLKKLNNLDLSNPNLNRFKSLNIKKFLPNKVSLFETILITANDEIVKLFLKNEIRFNQITPLIIKIIKKKEFSKFKKITPKNLEKITKLNRLVRLKIESLVYKFS
ncbi:1-deoxy-D-xylulose-5-phosphate reductoisomerase [Pelagibacterales bacterium SAG-MED47]|nr:1-deoxy-D-xylulose-5-phosphate reductoisomerase [Pelagibacterales bacterium SAG-MED47]